MVRSAVLGFPRIGPNRELKKATEAYWNGKISSDELLEVGKKLRAQNWRLQKNAGIDIIPSNDFSFYDQVLDHSIMFNVIPERYTQHHLSMLDSMFAMGRGLQRKATETTKAIDLTASEMVKWFDSNYHYVRPTFSHSTTFKLNATKPIDEFLEAKELGIHTRPVLLGPVSFLYLGKSDRQSKDLKPLSLLNKLLPIYVELLEKLAEVGATEVQIDEPVLVLDLDEESQQAIRTAYSYFGEKGTNIPGIILTTYFGTVVPNIEALRRLPVAGFHFDFVRAPDQLSKVLELLGVDQTLSVGIVSGRNIWKNNFAKSVEFLKGVVSKIGEDKVIVATSSSLLHTPVDLYLEEDIDPEIKDFFSFATQKLDEVVTIAKAVSGNEAEVADKLEANANSIEARRLSKIIHDPAVEARIASINPDMLLRDMPFQERLVEQNMFLKLPLLPTTTIGSFPQTRDIRINRNKFRRGDISSEEYEAFINSEIEKVIKFQEEVGLDVPVHGEPERNDMVQYFAEKLKGYVFTNNGWVQSYGSRYVRPPIIVGDLSRPGPMSIRELVYAQSLTKKPVKGILTGPVTCLRWSFPRDDIDYKTQAFQLALALRDEVCDLEAAGIKIIQVDEPAIREGLPLRAGEERSAYQKWAAEAFRLATSGVLNRTQIHSHFCYSDLEPSQIKALDADVVAIEFSKKDDPKYLSEFREYPNHIGLGLYDIHSPRIPPKEEFIEKIKTILESYPVEKLWVNPDCGLKTREWEETKEALTNMVAAAKYFREQLQK